ncbi:anthranilate phosphoribosyltransferase [Candidatus Poribacteria bacterium]|nr:anthranilate phosphoribosyltransferase [Candidatus Poribacteria bacterium]
MIIQEAIQKVVNGENLTEQEAIDVMNIIMSGEVTPAQIASFITALRLKGETIEEITGCARVMREKATKIYTNLPLVVDTCGTGGDGAHTFNISTTAALVAAGADVPIAKHGNRSVSSRCGSADVLKTLGVNIKVEPDVVGRCIDEIGIGFLFAPLLHGAMKYAIGPRREIGIRTIFNILGPLTNPAGAQAQVLGVYDANLTEPLAKVLKNLGSKHVFVVHGKDGLDEITTTTDTQISELANGKVRTYTLAPIGLGVPKAKTQDLIGGTPEENAAMMLDVLQGKPGPKRDIVLLNAAAAIVAGGKAGNLRKGIAIAADAIDSGKALEKLEALKEMTNS